MDNTPEPRRLGRIGVPLCHLMSGICTAYFATIFGVGASARETYRRASGNPRYRFDITLEM